MKNTRIPSYISKIICTDGSTVKIKFPFNKSDIFLTNDLKNNSLFFSPNLINNSRTSTQKVKQKSLQFDFYSLMNKNK